MENKTDYMSDWTLFYNSTRSNALYGFVQGMYVYAIPVISILGIFGNTCSLKVFVLTYFRRYPSSIYLAALSFSDTWFLIALFISWFGSINTHLAIEESLCLFIVYITYVTGFLSVWYVVMIMIDRYIVVCHPLQKPKLCTKSRVTVAAISVTVFAHLFYAHVFVTMEAVNMGKEHHCTSKKEYVNVLTVFTYIDTVITFVMPFIAATIMSIRVIFTIRRFSYKFISRYEKKYFLTPFNTLSKAQYRLTKMLIVLTCVFIVLNLPSHAFRFYILVNDLLDENGLNLMLIQQICQIIYYINFSINFYLYVATSKHFRRCLHEPVACKSASGYNLTINKTKQIRTVRNIELQRLQRNSYNRSYTRQSVRIRIKTQIAAD